MTKTIPFQRTILFIVPLCLISLISLVSNFSYQNNTNLLSFYNFIGKIFPTVNYYAHQSEFPYLTLSYYSLLAFISPYYLWFGFAITRHEYKRESERYLRAFIGLKGKLRAIGFLALIIILPYFTFFINPGMEFSMFPVSKEKWALLLTGWVLSVSSGTFFLGCGFAAVEFFIRSLFNSKEVNNG